MSEQPAPDPEGQEPESERGFIGMGAAIGIGAAVGLVFGTMLDNLALGLACGAGVGTVAGAILEARGKRS